MRVHIFPKQFDGQLIGIAMKEVNMLHATVHQHLEADRTRHMSTVDDCSTKGDTVYGRLNYEILFSMNGAAQLMPSARLHHQFFSEASSVGTMFELRRCTIVAGSDDVATLHRDCANLTSAASSTFRNKLGILHKEVIPFAILPDFFVNQSSTGRHAIPHTLCI